MISTPTSSSSSSLNNKRRDRSNSSPYWSSHHAPSNPPTLSYTQPSLTLSSAAPSSPPRSRKHSVARYPHSSTPPARSFSEYANPVKTPPLANPFFTSHRPGSPKKSASSPFLHSQVHAYRPIYPSYPQLMQADDSGDDRDDDSSSSSMIYTSRASSSSSKHSAGASTRSSTSLRSRLFGGPGPAPKGPKSITTAPGQPCAGETETEVDEPVSSASPSLAHMNYLYKLTFARCNKAKTSPHRPHHPLLRPTSPPEYPATTPHPSFIRIFAPPVHRARHRRYAV